MNWHVIVHNRALWWTIFVYAFLFILLLWISIKGTFDLPESQDIIVMEFGKSDDYSKARNVPGQQPATPATAVSDVSRQSLLTQEEDSPAFTHDDRGKSDSPRQRTEVLSAEEMRKRQQEEDAKKINTQMQHLFGKQPGSESEVRGGGEGEAEEGRDDQNSISTEDTYSLGDRKLAKPLPKPKKGSNEMGTVVVRIVVDRKGKVLSAMPGQKGTNTDNRYLWEEAKKAALKASFNANPKAQVEQIGSITYHFKITQ